MKNEDLIALLQPAPNRFHAMEWRDATGTIQDITNDGEKLVIRSNLPAGIYQGGIITLEGAFDMRTAMVEMTRVPDGARVPFGPWDLNHLENIMAIPMALVTVNGRFRGGLWFSMPGPEQIATGVLKADFGFEHEGGAIELELTLSERDRERLSWNKLKFFELRKDDRRFLEWKPCSSHRPRFFTAGLEREALARKLRAHEGFEDARRLLEPPVEEWNLYHGQNDGIFDLACLIGYATKDDAILTKAKQALTTLCKAKTWSGRPNPLLMGGDNDRGIGFKLSVAGMGWEFLRDSLTKKERQIVLSKSEEYLGTIYDFTLLQRGYMGCPSLDPHSMGTWWGVGIACMAFYDELPIARKALPFFHALMIDSLSLFPASGKAPWVTYYPIWLAHYFSAAIEFGGRIREVEESPFLNHLAEALRVCFRSPNSQEMQRGLRTMEHRILTAFLNAFHPTSEAASLYAAFTGEERREAGNVRWGMFDLLYAPAKAVEPATFPVDPFFARDTGDVIATVGPRRVSIQINGGYQSGAKSSFHQQPHNREYDRSMGDFILGVNGDPVIIKLNGSYGLFSAQRNALCFEDGAAEWEGQYLYGDLPADRTGFVRRYCRNGRFIYVNVNFTLSLKTKLNIRYAQRTFLADCKTGVILLQDAWESSVPLKVGTHLHCSGRVKEESRGYYRLTGGQANTIAGIKFGDMGMTDDERGEIYVQVLNVSEPWRIRVEEPCWFPSYIYRLNGEPDWRIEDARYPKLQRWRLELNERVRKGYILFSLNAGEEKLAMQDGQVILPDGVTYYPGGEVTGKNWSCFAETVTHDRKTGQIMAIGVNRWISDKRQIVFRIPVDICCNTKNLSGVIHSPAENPVSSVVGFEIKPPVQVANHPRSLFNTELYFNLI